MTKMIGTSGESRATHPSGPLSVAVALGSVSRRAGGLFESVRASALALHRQGHAVSVFALRDSGTAADIGAWAPLVPDVLPAVGPRALGLAPQLAARLRAGDFDVAHQHGIWQCTSLAVSSWRRRHSRPVVISPRGMLDPWAVANAGLKKKFVSALYERGNLRGAACLHALNAAEADAIRAYGLAKPIAIIPNGVDLPPADFRPSRPAFLAGDQRKVLLFLGRIHPKKGLEETLRALARALRSKPSIVREWLLVIAGWDDGGHVERLRRLSGELGVEGSVCFTGPVFGEDKACLLNAADAFILASHSEGLPMAVLEAWAHERPVLMSSACNLPEGFAAGAAVEIPVEPEKMATIIAHSLADPELPRLGASGRALVAESFSWERVGKDLAAVYAWVSGRGPRPECVKMA